MKAYAVLGSDDHFVGIWRGRETAENVMARSAWAKGERIVEMVSAESVAELEAERDRWERNCLEWRVAHDTLCAELDARRAICARATHLLDGIKRAGWVTNPACLDEVNSLRAAIDAAKEE